jgi:hypothetical protein
VGSYDLLGFLGALPRASAPRVVALDDAGIHTSDVIRAARPRLARAGAVPPPALHLQPEPNRIEPVFRQIKRQAMPPSATTRSA